MNKILMVLVFGLVLAITAQPTNNAAEEKDDCSYDDAIFCLPEIEDIIGNCLLSANIEACIIDELGDGNDCISCVCAILEMINLSC